MRHTRCWSRSSKPALTPVTAPAWRSVACNGVTAVGVRSERRGEGVAGAALRVCLQDALAMGVPLLSLHPTSDVRSCCEACCLWLA